MLRAPLPLLALLCCAAAVRAQSTPPASACSSAPQATPPAALPDPRQLLLDVEQNQRRAEAEQRDYTYHVHTELDDLDKRGQVRKVTTTDAESLTLRGVRVDRLVARNGHPLTPDETRKEDARLDRQVDRALEREREAAGKGSSTDAQGNALIPASRILELGTFSNPRRILLNGRPTLVLDYAGDPNARTHGASEGIIRDLVGTVWIDATDRVMVRAEAHFLSDFKLAGGLLADIHKGFHFDFAATCVAPGVWLPAVIEGAGTARLLLLDRIDGRFRLVTSDYRRFRTGVTLIPADRVIGADGQPVPPRTEPPHPQ